MHITVCAKYDVPEERVSLCFGICGSDSGGADRGGNLPCLEGTALCHRSGFSFQYILSSQRLLRHNKPWCESEQFLCTLYFWHVSWSTVDRFPAVRATICCVRILKLKLEFQMPRKVSESQPISPGCFKTRPIIVIVPCSQRKPDIFINRVSTNLNRWRMSERKVTLKLANFGRI